MARAKNWTDDEDLWLEENWGKLDLNTLSVMLGRAEVGITLRAKRIGLGPSKDGQGLLNANQLSKSLGIDRHCITDYWIPQCGFPAFKKVTKKVMAFWMIRISEFWKWAETNQDKFDSRRFEAATLGPEPEWMESKRAADERLPVRRLQIWTPDEDLKLLKLKQEGHAHVVIGELMGRSENSVERRVARLRNKERNVTKMNRERALK